MQSMPMLKKLIYQILVESKFCAGKGTISTEHFGELVKIEKEEVAQNVATSVVFTLIFFQL